MHQTRLVHALLKPENTPGGVDRTCATSMHALEAIRQRSGFVIDLRCRRFVFN